MHVQKINGHDVGLNYSFILINEYNRKENTKKKNIVCTVPPKRRRKVEKVKPVKRTQEKTTKMVHQKKPLQETTSRCFCLDFLTRSLIAAAVGNDNQIPKIHVLIFLAFHSLDFKVKNWVGVVEILNLVFSWGCSKALRKRYVSVCIWEREREKAGECWCCLWPWWCGEKGTATSDYHFAVSAVHIGLCAVVKVSSSEPIWCGLL